MKRYTKAEIEEKAQELFVLFYDYKGNFEFDTYADRFRRLARHVLGVPEETEDEKAGRRAREAFYTHDKFHDVRHLRPWSEIGCDQQSWIAAAKAARGEE